MRLFYHKPLWGLVPLLISSVLSTPTPQQTTETNGTLFLPSLFPSNPSGIPTSESFSTDGTLQGSLILHNGRIHTLSPSNPVISVLAIKSGRVVYTGTSLPAATSLFSTPPKTIDLHQRTAIPGLIDSHNHVVLLGNRPGYHTPLEYASSIPDVQRIVRERIRNDGVPEGKWVTTIGGFSPNQLAPGLRLPTLEELDDAAPDHPVFISTSFSGPATANTRGKEILTSLDWEYGPVNVAENGSISSGLENGKALLWLRRQLTLEDRKRSVRDAMAYAASVGVTTHLDQGAFTATNTPADLAASEDLFTFHKPWLSVYTEHKGIIRLRLNFLHEDNSTSNPTLAQRLLNTFPFFGNDMVRTGAVGEFHVSTADYAGGPSFDAGALKIAQAGWRLEVHSLTDTDYKSQIQSFEKINAQVPITNLRWVVAHVPRITDEYLARLKALGGGVNLSGWQYLAGTGNASNPAGPPWKLIVESGIPAGFGADGANIAPLSPWPHIYYAVTGKNAKGELINPGQTLSRQKALELYTRDNTWFLGGPDETSLGILEKGRLGDLVVLSEDYFTVPEERLKKLTSVLTVVGGVVVHESGRLKSLG
ncbi:amidohydrolase family-domain-containing protein [Cladorrhinum sp. PSN259]|nr:amidohydrolase family-domain-containing protein [Cladorrhinum sp. PSN259]